MRQGGNLGKTENINWPVTPQAKIMKIQIVASENVESEGKLAAIIESEECFLG